MNNAFGADTAEIKRVVFAVASEYYAEVAPDVADRLARAHQSAWEDVIAGRSAVAAFANLRRHVERFADADRVIDICNRHTIWALTPAIGASIACAPGEDFVSLREVGAALAHLLARSISAQDRRAAA